MANISIAAFMLIPGPLLVVIYWVIFGKAGYNFPMKAIALLPILPWALNDLPEVFVNMGLMQPVMQTVQLQNGETAQLRGSASLVRPLMSWMPGATSFLALFIFSLTPLALLSFLRWPITRKGAQ